MQLSRKGDRVPVSPEDFAALIEPLHLEGDFAIAVSGGGDSVALLVLSQEWASSRGGRPTAVTVDHGLRREAKVEVRQVGAWCGSLGVPHVVLTATGPAPETGIQMWARDERYRLLCNWAREAGQITFMVAHTRDDQAETVMMNLLRGSGVDGLCGMAAVTWRGGIRILRPFLGVSRARLRATLQDRGQAWIEDPSNQDPQFTRTRVRDALAQLSPLGLDSSRLVDTARIMARVRSALESETRRFLSDVGCGAFGEVVVESAKFEKAEREISFRALRIILRTVSGRESVPKAKKIEALLDWIARSEGSVGRTLHGCAFRRLRGRKVLGIRELSACAPPVRLAAGEERVWDDRWRVRLTADGGCEVGALGNWGEGSLLPKPEGWREIPHVVRMVLPAFRCGGRIVAVPPAGFFRDGWEARVDAQLTIDAEKRPGLWQSPSRPCAGRGSRA